MRLPSTRPSQRFRVEEARDPRLLQAIKSWGVHGRIAGTITGALNDLAELVERARDANGAPLYVRESKEIVAKLRDRLAPLAPRPGRAASVCAAALDLVSATPPFAAAIAHALLGTVRDELARSKRAKRALRLRRHALARRRGASRAGRQRALPGDAPTMALRAHRRVPGYRRDAVVDLPPRVLRPVRATPDRACCPRR